MEAYTPVSCDFHDELEAMATLHQDCQIIYRDEADTEQSVTDRIVDIYAANHADFIKLKNGIEIRMDRLVTVNGKSNDTCGSCG